MRCSAAALPTTSVPPRTSSAPGASAPRHVLRAQELREPLGVLGADARDRAVLAAEHLLERAAAAQDAVRDHDDVVDALRDLGQEVARHEHGAPRAACSRSSPRIQRIPGGSRPLTGSSRISTSGSPSSAAAIARRWRMPIE